MSGTNVTPNITFNEIPSPLYRPGSYLEVRPTFANVGILPFPARNLIIGQMLSAGSATAGVIQQDVRQPQQATALFGAGSIAEGMAIAYLNAGSTIPLDVIGISDAGGGTKAAWTVVFGGTWTVGGTTPLKVAGTRYAIGTLSSDTPSTTATAWAAAVNADPQAPVVATVATATVTLTAKNAGLVGNDISVIVSTDPGDALVKGMTCVITQTVQGASNPAIDSAITAIAGLWYTGIAIPWQDTSNLGKLTAELARRFGAMVREDSRAYLCLTGTFSQQLSAIATINSQFVAALPMTRPGSTPWAVAASMMAVCEASLVKDPSLQIRDVALPGIVAPQRSDLLDDNSQQMMLAGKGSTFRVLRDGTVTLQRVLTTYTNNSAGVPDSTTWFDIMETAVSSRIRWDWRQFLLLMFPTNKLAPDGSLAEQYNTNVCTPRRAKGAWASRMLTYAKQGWIENEVADTAAALFRINANDRNRLDYQVQYTRIGNLIVDAGVLEFEVL